MGQPLAMLGEDAEFGLNDVCIQDAHAADFYSQSPRYLRDSSCFGSSTANESVSVAPATRPYRWRDGHISERGHLSEGLRAIGVRLDFLQGLCNAFRSPHGL